MIDILIVEDEVKISSLLEDYLRNSGFTCETLCDGKNVIAYIKQHPPKLMLLDIMLPERDGTDILRELRSFSNLPVIMITARVDEIDRLLGLELGADDYICKPFSPREVVARVKAVLRRISNNTPNATEIMLDDDRFEATVSGNKLVLTKTEFALLKRLTDRPGQVFSRDKLIDGIYDDNRFVTSRTVDSHIKNLRKKIGEFVSDKEVIYSIYGVGYKYEK